jgi:hypothetical protein
MAGQETSMPSKLDQLAAMTLIVADTGDIDAVRRLRPVDCTTNPTLLLKAAEMPEQAAIVDEAVAWGRKHAGSTTARVAAVCDRLAVAFGAELAAIVPGRVSTEVDADLSFDTVATVDKARAIIRAYDQDRLDLGGNPRRRDAPEREDRLQPDPAVLADAGGGGGRRARLPHLAFRRPHPRLACEGRRRPL